MFDKVSTDDFLTASSFARAAPLAGRFVYVLLFTWFNIKYDVHSYLALAAQIVALLIAAILLKFNRMQPSTFSLQLAPSDMITQLQTAISNQRVAFYSIWYIISVGVLLPFVLYQQNSNFLFHAYQGEVSIKLDEKRKVSLNLLLKYLFYSKK